MNDAPVWVGRFLYACLLAVFAAAYWLIVWPGMLWEWWTKRKAKR